MDNLQIILLALIQGITEFLPISSSGHLILPSHILGFSDQGLIFDVAVHLGTLMAVIGYFHKELKSVSMHWLSCLTGGASTDYSHMGWCLIVASLPTMIVGFVVKQTGLYENFRSIPVIAWTTLIFGLILGVSDFIGKKETRWKNMAIWQASLIGLMQSIALVPGTSRSGITITAALLLGFTRESSARFSFMLSIPIILGAVALLLGDLWVSEEQVDWVVLFLGLIIAGATAWLCIHFFLEFINQLGYLPFVVYRVALGVLLLGWFYSGYMH